MTWLMLAPLMVSAAAVSGADNDVRGVHVCCGCEPSDAGISPGTGRVCKGHHCMSCKHGMWFWQGLVALHVVPCCLLQLLLNVHVFIETCVNASRGLCMSCITFGFLSFCHGT